MSRPQTPRPGPRGAALPAGVWALGFTSLLMDVSSEMIHSLLPLFMVGTLGASAVLVGLVEGLAEATALIVKVFSGALSDRLGKRKALALAGYSLGALTKPLFALAGGAGMVLAARLMDRVGKGIRGAPRDALVADLVPEGQRGAAFGLRQSLDTVGAFAGPLLATGLLLLWHEDLRAVFWVACIPAALAVCVLAIGVREPPRPGVQHVRNPLTPENLRTLGRGFWQVVLVGTVLGLARSSEAFLVLRASSVGIPLAMVPLAMVAMNLVYAAAAYPAGLLADRIPRERLLALGLLTLVAANAALALATGWGAVLLGVGLWGLQLGLTQGVLAAMVADSAPAELRGTAFGVFNLASGIAVLAAGLVAGLLWDAHGPGATFVSGAGFGLIALLALARLPQATPHPPG
ncbi:MAG: MFS transporter [Gammaproteobacteria bacterium]